VGVRRADKEFLSVNDAAVQHYGYDRTTFLRHKLWDSGRWMNAKLISRRYERSAMPIIPASTAASESRRSEIQVLTFGRRVAFEERDGFLVAIGTLPSGARPRPESRTWPTMTD